MSNEPQPTPAAGREKDILARLAAFVVLLAFALLAFAHLSNATETPAAATPEEKTIEITISNFTFTPSEITITPGTKVKWVNQDDIPHLVAEKALVFKSQALDTNDSFSFTFTKLGAVDYFCVLHPHMIGRIIVKAEERDGLRTKGP